MNLFKTLSKLAMLTVVVNAPSPAIAFDLEDYHTTFRATRDAWLRSYSELRDALPDFLAARYLAEAWGLDLSGHDKPFGHELPPEWCESWQGERIGHNINLGYETLDYSGSFDFYGRGHDMHRVGRGLGHHHDTTLVGDDPTIAAYVDGNAMLQWRERFIPGTSERVRDMIEAALAHYEETGHPRVNLRGGGCEYYYCWGDVADQLCKKCSPCPDGGRCDGMSEENYNWYYYGDRSPAFECLTETGEPGFTEFTACEGEAQYDFPTFEQALANTLNDNGYTLPDVPPDKCEPEWFDGYGCMHGDPTEWCQYTEGRNMIGNIFTTYRASRDRLFKAQNEFMLSIAPFKAATAAFAAAVEAYHSNNPCGGYLLPNLPNIPDMPGPAGEPQ
jgi:hypothetical protein